LPTTSTNSSPIAVPHSPEIPALPAASKCASISQRFIRLALERAVTPSKRSKAKAG
jgi:hypothetical protein